MGIISRENRIGAIAFLVGVVLAIVIGIGTSSIFSISTIVKYSSHIYAVLVLLGIIVGFSIKVSPKDTQVFLIACAVLVIVSKFGMESVTGSLIGIGIGDTVSIIFAALLVLFVPATIILTLKTVFSLVKV